MKFLVAVVALAAQVAAQTAFLPYPIKLWTANVAPAGEGNECALAPANPYLLCSSLDGSVSAIHTSTAAVVWTHEPGSASTSLSNSGITFHSGGSTLIYGLTDLDGTSEVW